MLCFQRFLKSKPPGLIASGVKNVTLGLSSDLAVGRRENVLARGGEGLELGVGDLVADADREIILRRVRTAGDHAVDDLGAPRFELSLERGVEVEAVFHRELQAGGAVGVRADGVAMHEILQQADEHRREHGGNEHARADGEADARRDPDAGRGGEALDRTRTKSVRSNPLPS